MKNLVRNYSLKPSCYWWIVFFTLTISMESYAGMPLFKCKIIGKADNLETVLNDYFGQINNVSYVAGRNDSTLFMKIEFQDFSSLMKVVQGGLNIYFDSSGKKKRSVCFKLEKESGLNQTGMFSRPGQARQNKKLLMENMLLILNSTYMNATWDNKGDKFIFNKNITHIPISADFSVNDKDNCVFNLSLPLNYIHFQNGQNTLSIGIETETITMQGFGGQSGGGGGMPGGSEGSRGGGGGRSMGGGRPSGGAPGGQGESAGSQNNSEPIRIWFQVQL
jgi:uncharacterized membrane protein YgcG